MIARKETQRIVLDQPLKVKIITQSDEEFDAEMEDVICELE